MGGRQAEFLVFRYRMPEGHWAGRDWILGLAGPFFEDDTPYSGVASGFSMCDDTEGKVTPNDIVENYVTMFERKTGGWSET